MPFVSAKHRAEAIKKGAADIAQAVAIGGEAAIKNILLSAFAFAINGPLGSLVAFLQQTGGNVDAAQLEAAVAKLPADLEQKMAQQLLKTMAKAAAVEAKLLVATKGLGGKGGVLKFDLTNPIAVKWAQEKAGALIKEISTQQREAIKATIAAAIGDGHSWKKTAQVLRTTVGLTSYQAQVVDNFKQRLLKVGHSPEEVMKLGAKKAAQIRRRRAELIARTENNFALNQGQQLLWEQAIDSGHIDSTRMKKWIVRYPRPDWSSSPFPVRGRCGRAARLRQRSGRERFPRRSCTSEPRQRSCASSRREGAAGP
jgi:hypothetical protein